MTEYKKSKSLPIKLAVAVFALLLVTVVTATEIRPAYADDGCHEDDGCDGGDGGNCIVNALGVSVCDSIQASSAK